MNGIDIEALEEALALTSDDDKMLLINGRYYCELTASQTSRELLGHCKFFSELYKEPSSPAMTQSASCFVLDTYVAAGSHQSQYGSLSHSVHSDLDGMHTMSLMLSQDRALVSVVSISIVNKPFPLHKMMELVDRHLWPDDYVPEDGDPMLSIDGVAFVDFGKHGSKHASLEYYVNGKLYFEVVDFEGIPEFGIVSLDDASRREVLVDMQTLDSSNVQSIAKTVEDTLKKLKSANASS